MTEKTIEISTVAEEFAAGMEFFRQRALMRAAQLDEMKTMARENPPEATGVEEAAVPSAPRPS